MPLTKNSSSEGGEERSKKKAKRSQSNAGQEGSNNSSSSQQTTQFSAELADFDSFDSFNPTLEWGQNSEIKQEESRPFWGGLEDMLSFPQGITIGGFQMAGPGTTFPINTSNNSTNTSNISPQSSPISAPPNSMNTTITSNPVNLGSTSARLGNSHDLSEESPPSSPQSSSNSVPLMNNIPSPNSLFFNGPFGQVNRSGVPGLVAFQQLQGTPLQSSLNSVQPQTPQQSQSTSNQQQQGTTNNVNQPFTSSQNVSEILAQRPSAKAIQEVQKLIPQISSRLEAMGWNQKQLALPLRRELVSALDKEQKEMKNLIEIADKQLNNLIDTVFLEPIEMHQILQLQQELFFHLKQLELYNIELQGIQKDHFVPSMALVIVSQPFPESVKQKKKIDEPGVTVRLLTGARFTEPKPNAVVKAEIISFGSSSNKTKKSTLTLENGDKALNETGIARFTDLNFPNGTRLKSVRLKFTSRVDVADSLGQLHTITVESNPSNPIVVKTNENQWFEAEGILLQKAAFGNALEITWQRLANWLQRRYLMATRQSFQNPNRPLSQHDLNYLHRLKFQNAPRITQKDFDKFWEWCGPLFHKIRYQRHLNSLWTTGYICGFLTREEVETVLKNQAVGTFLIRFSDRMPKFVVSYQSAEGSYNQTKVKHYLVKSDDTHGAKKTLPDFLNAYRELLCILQIWTDPVTNKRILRRCDKDTALKDFYSRKSETGHNGYEEDINISY